MKKGQAAMEFLMTYGWAILVVLIAIGALVYFGVISPERFVQDNCTLTPPLSCSELGDFAAFRADTNNVRVRVNNGAGATVNLQSVTLTETDGNTCTRLDNATSVNSGAELEVRFTCNDVTAASAVGTRFTGDLDIIYSLTGGSYNQTSNGKVVVRVQ
ncbi:hypothetical protein J4216_04720 [Candidatus Woesearchaeota archaeon]|nr:hypothetical protein [Candidatus Woesearchaeota archaeon]